MSCSTTSHSDQQKSGSFIVNSGPTTTSQRREKQRVLIQTTSKRDCPAIIIIREYEVFPEYALKEEEIKNVSGHALRQLHAEKLEELGKALQDGKSNIHAISMYHISLPNGAHKGHECGQESGMAQCMHLMVSRKNNTAST